MKKIFLLFTILSAATCAEQLHGMKKEFRLRRPYKADDKLLRFTEMVHAIKTDPEKDPYQVAELFETPISQKYCTLCDKLKEAVAPFGSETNPKEVERLLDEGADPNCSLILDNALTNATRYPSIIISLLQYGAKTNIKNRYGRTPLEQIDYTYSKLPDHKGYQSVREQLITAMEHRQ